MLLLGIFVCFWVIILTYILLFVRRRIFKIMHLVGYFAEFFPDTTTANQSSNILLPLQNRHTGDSQYYPKWQSRFAVHHVFQHCLAVINELQTNFSN